MDIAAGNTNVTVDGVMVMLFNCPRSTMRGGALNPPVKGPSDAEDYSVARGDFNTVPMSDAIAKPISDDGNALVTRGSNRTVAKHSVAMDIAG